MAGKEPTTRQARLGTNRQLAFQTLAVHGPLVGNYHAHGHAQAQPVTSPIHVSTTYHRAPSTSNPYPTGKEDPELPYVYSRERQPVWDLLERGIAALEGGGSAVVYASGVSALFACLVHWKPKRVLISEGYHGSHAVLRTFQQIRGGPDSMEIAPLPSGSSATTTKAPLLQPGDLLWLESPRNCDGVVMDISAWVQRARSVQDCHVCVDATFAPAPLQQPLLLGVDAVLHSTTKLYGGHSDLLGGVLVVPEAGVALELKQVRTSLGLGMGSLEAWLLLRSLKTFPLRIQQQSRSATLIAAWLHGGNVTHDDAWHQLTTPTMRTLLPPHPSLQGILRRVLHASLPGSDSHEIAKRQMPGGHSPILAVECSTAEAARLLPWKLRLFQNATSLGGVESLVDYRHQHAPDVSPLLVRLSIGLEDPIDLCWDLHQAFLALLQRKSQL